MSGKTKTKRAIYPASNRQREDWKRYQENFGLMCTIGAKVEELTCAVKLFCEKAALLLNWELIGMHHLVFKCCFDLVCATDVPIGKKLEEDRERLQNIISIASQYSDDVSGSVIKTATELLEHLKLIKN